MWAVCVSVREGDVLVFPHRLLFRAIDGGSTLQQRVDSVSSLRPARLYTHTAPRSLPLCVTLLCAQLVDRLLASQPADNAGETRTQLRTQSATAAVV